MATKQITILKEHVDKVETQIGTSLKSIQERLTVIETSGFSELESTDEDGRTITSKVDKFDLISQSLINISVRLEQIEKSSCNHSTDIGSEKDEILAKIEAMGNEIALANDKLTESIKNDISHIKTVVIEKLKVENTNIKSRIAVFENRMVEAERHMYKMDQHGRKVNFEINGLPDNVVNTKENKNILKETVVKLFQHSGIADASTADIEVIHRLPYSKSVPKPVIIKARRDFIEKVVAVKKDFINVGINHMAYTNKLYINDNLCPYYNKLAYNCRQLKKDGQISDTWFSNYTLKIKTLDEEIKTITHEYDLVKLFPDFQFSFDTAIYLIKTNSLLRDSRFKIQEFFPHKTKLENKLNNTILIFNNI